MAEELASGIGEIIQTTPSYKISSMITIYRVVQSWRNLTMRQLERYQTQLNYLSDYQTQTQILNYLSSILNQASISTDSNKGKILLCLAMLSRSLQMQGISVSVIV